MRQAPGIRGRIPNGVFVAAVFILGGAVTLLADRALLRPDYAVARAAYQRVKDDSARLSRIDSSWKELSPADWLDKTQQEMARHQLVADRWDASHSGGLPVGIASLGLTPPQRSQIEMILRMMEPGLDSLRQAFFPQLKQLSATTLRDLACVLTREQRRKWIMAISPPDVEWMNDSIVVFVDDTNRKGPDPTQALHRIQAIGGFGIFGSELALDQWCREHAAK